MTRQSGQICGSGEIAGAQEVPICQEGRRKDSGLARETRCTQESQATDDTTFIVMGWLIESLPESKLGGGMSALVNRVPALPPQCGLHVHSAPGEHLLSLLLPSYKFSKHNGYIFLY